MSNDAIDRHYGRGGILERIEAGLRAAGKDLDSVTPDDLAPVDAFHTRGKESTVELAAMAGLKASDRLVDVGCGLGGTARYLASTVGCHVEGIDLTEEYVAVARRLTELVGLEDRVVVRQASALALPFDDASFDTCWTEHAQMNISDKGSFYREIVRVLKPDGRLMFHDVFRGAGSEPIYPVPWAETAALSALATEAEARATMKTAGLEVDTWADKRAPTLAFFREVFARVKAGGPPPLGIHLLMGDNAQRKLQNYVRNIEENRTAVAMGVASKTG